MISRIEEYFPSYLERTILASEVHLTSSVSASLQRLFLHKFLLASLKFLGIQRVPKKKQDSEVV